ncbi:MAG: RsmB/NOP family class I SAM-dependent RNA methyltransferase [Marinosulfonomonas sp.]
MTPSARYAAAIDILDRILTGEASEKVLTTWARSNRYAGSGDRAAIRDLVFEAVRCRASYGHLGGANTGRGIMIGLARVQGLDVNSLFSGDKYAPHALSPEEQETHNLADAPRSVRLDCPEWLLPLFDASLKDQADAVLELSRTRAPVFLRVNTAKTDRDRAIHALADDGVIAIEHPLSETALEVRENPRRVAVGETFQSGMVELQDAASQAVVDALPLDGTSHVLDFCAGGGGKSLAIAAKGAGRVVAHDALPARMKDIPDRAKRAGAKMKILTLSEIGDDKFDLVLCDVPCSGSGSWRRSPDGKWDLTQARLEELVSVQMNILEEASEFVDKNGVLAYVTCSMFDVENARQVEAFIQAHPEWSVQTSRQFTPLDGGDGFHISLLTRV